MLADRSRLARGFALGAVLVLVGASGEVRGELPYFISEGVAFHAYEVKGPFRQPLFRIKDSQDLHGFTTSEAIRSRMVDQGMTPENSGMFVLTQQLEGSKPLYQFMRKGTDDIRTILTVSKEGCENLRTRTDEFQEIRNECYVFPPEFKPSFEPVSPVYCLRNPFSDERLYIVSQSEIEALLSRWDKRKKRLMTDLQSLVTSGKTIHDMVPVGRRGELGGVGWQFSHQEAIGRELGSLRTRGEYIYIDMTLSNESRMDLMVKAPDLLIGNTPARVPVDASATASFVTEPELQLKPGTVLKPGESRKFRMVYDVPSKARDVVIEATGGEAAPNLVVLMDIGR